MPAVSHEPEEFAVAEAWCDIAPWAVRLSVISLCVRSIAAQPSDPPWPFDPCCVLHPFSLLSACAAARPTVPRAARAAPSGCVVFVRWHAQPWSSPRR